jgi:hypothetical protein
MTAITAEMLTSGTGLPISYARQYQGGSEEWAVSVNPVRARRDIFEIITSASQQETVYLDRALQRVLEEALLCSVKIISG